MARTVNEIYQTLLDRKSSEAALDGLTAYSTTAIWRLFYYIYAVAINVHETYFDAHVAEVTELLKADKPHTPKWYAGKAKLFQIGYSLDGETDEYAVIDEAARIITESAAEESEHRLILKVAKTYLGLKVPLFDSELTPFTEYVRRVKDAGVRVEIRSVIADNLKLTIEVGYDELVLDENGDRIDGTAAGVAQSAIIKHIQNLPFNGVYFNSKLADAIQAVEGVRSVRITYSGANFLSTTDDPYTPFDEFYKTYSGYMLFDSGNSTITYVAVPEN